MHWDHLYARPWIKEREKELDAEPWSPELGQGPDHQVMTMNKARPQ